MLRVYLDEDVDVLLARLLGAHGFDCMIAAEAGYLGRSDAEHLEIASRQNRVLITHDRKDFARLAALWWSHGKDHAGIVLALRRADTYELARGGSWWF